MGQYYKPVIFNKGRMEVYHAHKFKEKDNSFTGLKLMEHSWLPNHFVLAVAKRIYKNPCRIAWVGDYAEDSDLPDVAKHAGDDAIMLRGIYHRYPGRKSKECSFTMRGKFLVNHTQKRYVDIEEWAVKTDKDGWVANPLPLFTAIGNGRGGGDYRGANNKKIGAWAWDIISIEDEAPTGFVKERTLFYPC